MTSTHKLVAIILVWAAAAFMAAMLSGVAITNFMPGGMITAVYITLALAAAVATFFIARSTVPHEKSPQ